MDENAVSRTRCPEKDKDGFQSNSTWDVRGWDRSLWAGHCRRNHRMLEREGLTALKQPALVIVNTDSLVCKPTGRTVACQSV